MSFKIGEIREFNGKKKWSGTLLNGFLTPVKAGKKLLLFLGKPRHPWLNSTNFGENRHSFLAHKAEQLLPINSTYTCNSTNPVTF